jgi:hypothetical protein
MFAGLAVPDKVATLLAESQQVLGISSADGSMIPSGERAERSQSPAETGCPQPDLQRRLSTLKRAVANSQRPVTRQVCIGSFIQ